jgi:hypothetical protein
MRLICAHMQKYNRAKWCGVRDSAHEKLQTLSNDPLPEVPYIFNIQMWSNFLY